MAIFNFILELDKNYIDLIKDIYKVITILIIFQVILYYSNSPKNILSNALLGTVLNDDFITLLVYIMISISSYYLIFDKLISIE
jgi:hypothetical protein